MDLLVIARTLPLRRRERLREFDAIEAHLRPTMERLEKAGFATRLSPVLRTVDELRTATPLMLDLTEDAVVLHDPDGVL